MKKILLLSFLTILTLTSCSSPEKNDSTSKMDEISSKQEEDFSKGRKKFDESSKEIYNFLKNRDETQKAYENEGTYIIVSNKNLITTYLTTEEKKMESINLILNNRFIQDNNEDRKLVLGYFKDIFTKMKIKYDEEKIISLLETEFHNTTEIKNTDYKFYNYGSDIWFRMVGIPNSGDNKGNSTGVEINISKNAPEKD